MARNKKIKEPELMYLVDGLVLKQERIPQRENRLLALFLKGLTVYLVVMGGVGGFLSAVGSDYSVLLLNLIVFAEAMYCCMLFYNKIWQNLGYLLLLALMIFMFYIFRYYVASGMFAVYNDFQNMASDYFDSNATRTLDEFIEDRKLAITIGMGYLSVIFCLLSNIQISRAMRYSGFVADTVVAWLIPAYFDKEPNPVYFIMLLAGTILVYARNAGGHYKLSFSNADYSIENADALKKKKKKKKALATKKLKLNYNYRNKIVITGLLASFIFSIIVISVVGIIYPKNTFKSNHKDSKLKESTKEYVENFTLLGLAGMINWYRSSGGISSGELGGVASINYDYQTDFTIKFVPYTYERMYIKQFIGTNYLAFENRWEMVEYDNKINLDFIYNLDEKPSVDENNTTWQHNRKRFLDSTVLAYKIIGDDQISRGLAEDKMTAARAVMEVIDPVATSVYLPYYTMQVDKMGMSGNTTSYTYYPKVTDNQVYNYLGEAIPDEFVYTDDLHISNYVDVVDIIRETAMHMGLDKDSVNEIGVDGVVAKIAEFFQNNYPYTLRPGSTPYNEDFVSYFLTTNKKGYCVHFATAGTLILRYLGIPARYVEGYAVDANEIIENAANESDPVEDYYVGYNPLGSSGVISLEIPDADGHAWIEVYDEKEGWYPVEVTPSSDEEEDTSQNALYSFLMNLFLMNGQGAVESNTNNTEENNTGEALKDFSNKLINVVGIFLVAVLVIALLILLGMFLVKFVRYSRADINDKLIIKYHDFIKKRTRRSKELSEMINYEEQLNYLFDNKVIEVSEENAKMAGRILDKAGFSDMKISEEEFEFVINNIIKARRLKSKI